jgi:hypothetical protein
MSGTSAPASGECGDARRSCGTRLGVENASHGSRAVLDYIARHIAEGKSRRDATRLLKRSLARHLYRLLEQQQQPLMT